MATLKSSEATKPVEIYKCDTDHGVKLRVAQYRCPECKGTFCNGCASETDGECPNCEPPILEEIE